MYKYELPVFQGASLLIHPAYTPVYSPPALYNGYVTFRFTRNWIVKVYRAILPRGIIAQTFRPISVMCSLPSYPRRATKRRRYA